ncbi:hypothetical protein EW146_g5866 [Bondarzewia mesenterica]|uniref:Uncharacterized protein n=1 Tax=Bondarzewia mesenterica TaxID=1095465 RepID=A0A4S4LR79_9AGAM|nr:hypothetical protein EW146_g5866 [Bondarzewia mesenterica]
MFSEGFAVIVVLSAVSSTLAHGVISSPQRHLPGSNLSSVCGSQTYILASSNQYGNQQAEHQLSEHNTLRANSTLYLHSGLTYADNIANVQNILVKSSPSRLTSIVSNYSSDIGNVSVSAAQLTSICCLRVIGSPLYTIEDASRTLSRQTRRVFRLRFLTCSTACPCVLQWKRDAMSIDQTYMSSVDPTQ